MSAPYDVVQTFVCVRFVCKDPVHLYSFGVERRLESPPGLESFAEKAPQFHRRSDYHGLGYHGDWRLEIHRGADALVRKAGFLWIQSCRVDTITDTCLSLFLQYLSNRIKCIDKLTGGPFLE